MQKMFAENIGNVSVKSSITNVPIGADTTEQLFYSVTKDSKNGTVYLKVVNVADATLSATIDIKSNNKILTEGEVTILTSEKVSDTNSLVEPKKVVPKTSVAKGLGNHFNYSFKPHSVTVLKMGGK